jgi:hypothetical protein
VWTSPFQTSFADYLGRTVTISITFDNTTLAITNPGLTGNRDVGCLYDRVLIGRPDGTLKVFLIPEGAFSLGRAQLANQGFNLITDVVNANITLGTTETPT